MGSDETWLQDLLFGVPECWMTTLEMLKLLVGSTIDNFTIFNIGNAILTMIWGIYMQTVEAEKAEDYDHIHTDYRLVRDID